MISLSSDATAEISNPYVSCKKYTYTGSTTSVEVTGLNFGDITVATASTLTAATGIAACAGDSSSITITDVLIQSDLISVDVFDSSNAKLTDITGTTITFDTNDLTLNTKLYKIDESTFVPAEVSSAMSSNVATIAAPGIYICAGTADPVTVTCDTHTVEADCNADTNCEWDTTC